MRKKEKEGLLLNSNITIEITNDGIDNACSVTASLGESLYETLTSLALAQKNVELLIEMYIQYLNKDRERRMTESEFEEMIKSTPLQVVYDKLSKK